MKKTRPSSNWYILIERTDMQLNEIDPIVIGPFDDEDAATKHMDNSMDVEDWLGDEAKEQQYIVDDIRVRQDVPPPPLGYNAPVMDDDETFWVPLGGKNDQSYV